MIKWINLQSIVIREGKAMFAVLKYFLAAETKIQMAGIMKQVCLIYVCFWISISDVLCQRITNGDSAAIFFGSQAHLGKIIAHSRSIADLTGSYIWGVETDLSRVRYTADSWSTCNCYSQNGITLSYFNYNNAKELGSSINFAVFAEPQLTYSRLIVSFRAAAGISYITRAYHPTDNPRNLFFSNRWNGLLLVQLNARYPLSSHWRLRGGTSYNHISNGGSRQPNKGMNFPTFSVGVEYSKPFVQVPPRRKKSIVDNSLHYYFGLSFNSRSVDESAFNSREREIVVGMNCGLYKPVSRMHAAGFGLEAFHDNAVKEQVRRNGGSFDHRIVSGLINHHFLFGRFDFSQALGIYLYKDYPTPDEVFQRYSIYYRMLGKLQAGFSLKAHLYIAEQMDVRLRILF